MSSKNIEDVLLIDSGVLFYRDSGDIYVHADDHGKISGMFDSVPDKAGLDKKYWRTMARLMNVNIDSGMRRHVFNFIKFTNIYNSPVLYIEGENSAIIQPVSSHIKIIESAVFLKHFREFFMSQGANIETD